MSRVQRKYGERRRAISNGMVETRDCLEREASAVVRFKDARPKRIESKLSRVEGFLGSMDAV